MVKIVRFAHPELLILFLLLPLLIWRLRHQKSVSVRFSDLRIARQIPTSFWVKQLPLLNLLRFLVVVLVIFALARPQLPQSRERVTSEGIDILLILDISESMLAEDFKPANRLQAAKEVIRDFLNNRKNDRIGLIVFAGESFTLCPLTLDYRVLRSLLRDLELGFVADGTAIGDALANAVNRLKHSDAKSKIAILLTDGENNAGDIDPLTAAQLAKALDIKVYTIGVGKEGGAPVPYHDPIFGKQYKQVLSYFDETVPKQIAEITGGRFFRATDSQQLSQIYREIDRLETTKIEMTQYVRYRELAIYLLFPAALLLILEIVLANTRLRKIP
jgi:Ca-activated chloride channel homolog